MRKRYWSKLKHNAWGEREKIDNLGNLRRQHIGTRSTKSYQFASGIENAIAVW
jgi:hypothetical protein